MKKKSLTLIFIFCVSIIIAQTRGQINIAQAASDIYNININLLSVKSNADTLMYYDGGLNIFVANPSDAAIFEWQTEELTGLALDTSITAMGILPGWNIYYYIVGTDTFFKWGSCSWFNPANQANNWIYFGPITIPSTGATLKWEHQIPDFNFSDGYKVFISNTGMSFSNFLTTNPVYMRPDNPPYAWQDTVWNVNVVDIPDIYNGQQVYFGFQHDASDMMFLFLSRWLISQKQTISGKVYHDVNENGQLDSGEQGIAGHLVKLEPGSHYTFTNNEGKFYFFADTGYHTVSYASSGYWYSTGNSSYNIYVDSIGQNIDTLNFAIKNLLNVNDVAIYVTGSPTRVGFQTYYWLTIKNWGTLTASGSVHFKYDSLLTFIYSTCTPASNTLNTLVFDYDTLGPGVQRTIRTDFIVPGFQYFGDTLYSDAWVTPIMSDTNAVNNYDTIVQLITGAYDPNDKQVTPHGYGSSGYILHGDRLTYTIRFQNTGTDTCFKVILRDTLSHFLDLSTIEFEAWSHDLIYELHTANELFIVFNNILLPDSNVNEPESHGFVRFSISPKQGLDDGTEVTNTAYIFFDFNPAIVTNTTLNTYVTNIPLSSPVFVKDIQKLILYPNPSSERIYINLPQHTLLVQVFDINGKIIQHLIPQNLVLEINIKDLPAGMYFLKMFTANGFINAKFLKE